MNAELSEKIEINVTDENEKTIVHPPNYIKFGKQLEPITGKELWDFYLPFDDTYTGVVWLLIDNNKKSACIEALLSGLVDRFKEGMLLQSIQINPDEKFISENTDEEHKDLVTFKGEFKIFKYLSNKKVPACLLESHWLTCKIEAMKEFTLVNSELITGNLAKVHIMNESFMDDDTFLVRL